MRFTISSYFFINIMYVVTLKPSFRYDSYHEVRKYVLTKKQEGHKALNCSLSKMVKGQTRFIV